MSLAKTRAHARCRSPRCACSSGSSPSTRRTRRDARRRPPRSLRPSSRPSVSRQRFVPLADGRANVVGRIDNGDGPCFAFNSHMDTVPAGGGWTNDPFRLTERDGKLFGRGACDAKGPIVAMVEAGRLLASQRDLWRGTLVLMFVADEEINGGGSRAAREAAAKARLDRYRRADQQCGLRSAQRLSAPAHPRQRQGRAFRPPGAWRECDPRGEPSHRPCSTRAIANSGPRAILWSATPV